MPPASASRKLVRGIEQVETLSAEARTFQNEEAYVFEPEGEPRSAEEIEYRCFAVERKPPLDHWPLLAGEAVHNLRAALDHFVYSAAKGRERGKTQFPIYTDPCEFQVLGPGFMKGVPKPVRARIEGAQPYRRTPPDPTEDALARLRTLSNRDKHRVLKSFAAAVTHEGVGLPDGATVEWKEIAGDKRLSARKTQVSRFIVRREGGIADVDVKPLFGYQVRIEGRPVQDLLWIARQVSSTLNECGLGQQPMPLPAASGKLRGI
jgi:hypothetical protein